TLQLAAIEACCEPGAVADAAAGALRLAELRAEMVAGLRSAGAEGVDGRAPFVLFRRNDAERVRNDLGHNGSAIGGCDTCGGVDGRSLRAGVRGEWPLLIQAIRGVSR